MALLAALMILPSVAAGLFFAPSFSPLFRFLSPIPNFVLTFMAFVTVQAVAFSATFASLAKTRFQAQCSTIFYFFTTVLDFFSVPISTDADLASCVTPTLVASTSGIQCNTGRRSSLLVHDHNYENSPVTSRKKFREIKENLHKVRTLAKVQKQQIKRIKKQVQSLKEVVSTLRKERRVSEEGLYCLDSFSDVPLQVCMRMLKNNDSNTLSREKYPPELRSFALTLHFYSPKAYNYVRKTFDFAFPHPAVLRSWYSSVDAESGFIDESFETLMNKVSVE